MAVKNRDNLQAVLKRFENVTIEQGQENAPLAPMDFEFRPLTEKDKKEFKSFRLPENEKRGLSRVLSELDSKEDMTWFRRDGSGNQMSLDPEGGHISNSQPGQKYPVWPTAVITFALGLTAVWLIFIGYGLVRLIAGAI